MYNKFGVGVPWDMKIIPRVPQWWKGWETLLNGNIHQCLISSIFLIMYKLPFFNEIMYNGLTWERIIGNHNKTEWFSCVVEIIFRRPLQKKGINAVWSKTRINQLCNRFLEDSMNRLLLKIKGLYIYCIILWDWKDQHSLNLMHYAPHCNSILRRGPSFLTGHHRVYIYIEYDCLASTFFLEPRTNILEVSYLKSLFHLQGSPLLEKMFLPCACVLECRGTCCYCEWKYYWNGN